MHNRKTILVVAGFSILVLLILNGRPEEATAVTEAITFTDSGQSLGNEFSTDVALGDLDGDGDQDAFVTNSASEPNQVWINQGGEQGGTQGIFLDSGQPLSNLSQRGLALGDLDGDTDLDAFVVRGIATDSYQVWINQGGEQGGTAGTFQQNSFTVNDNLGTNVILGDVDGDNDLDAYIPRLFDTDQIYLNNGNGLFSNSGQDLEAEDSLGAGLADLDGDDDLDVFTAVNNDANTVWINQGGAQGGTEGVFVNSGQTLGTGSSLNVALGDVDNDNDIDAYVANATENIVWINQGGTQGGTEGIFQSNGQQLGLSGSTDVKLADLDGDNDLDAFVAEFAGNTVWVNQGGEQAGTLGQFADSGLSLGSSSSRGVDLADVDGDGDIDAFVANSIPAPNKVYLNSDASAPPPLNPEGWQIQTVDTRGDIGRSSSLALDSQDQPHISYVQRRGQGIDYLVYGRWDGIQWQKTTIDNGYQLGSKTAIALDSQENPHIFYKIEPDEPELRHAHWDGSAWQINTVETNVSPDFDFALDSNDRPHISYIKIGDPDDELRYAYLNEAAWQTETLATNNNPDWESLSLALDGNDQPHLSYYDDESEALRYAHNNGGGWQTETIETLSSILGFNLSLALDSNNYPHIAYTKDSDTELAFAQWNGASWQIQTILSAPLQSNFASNLSLAFDSEDNAHISYAYDENDMDVSLRYIHWDGAQWQNETLDNSGATGYNNDIALDANDQVHISYYKARHGDLRYLHWGPNWQIRTVPEFGQIDAVDIQVQNGRPHLSYHNSTSTLLNATQWQSGWMAHPVINHVNSVPETSMAFTSNRQHLSYYDPDNQRLMYGRWNGTEWLLRVIDNEGDNGRYNQLVPLNNSDIWIGIAYWDATNRQIKLAVYDILNNTVEIHPNTLQPTLTANSGALSATALADGDVGVTYWDDGNQALRFAVWDSGSGTWLVDEMVANAAGQLNALKMDGITGYPVTAYYNNLNDSIVLAYRDETGWHEETAVPNAGNVTSLDLELGFQSHQYPRIVYTTMADSRFAYKQDGSWHIELIANNTIPTGAAALALDNRPYLAYPANNAGLQYVFRSATLAVNTAVHSQHSTGERYNSLTPCPVIVDFFFARAAFHTNDSNRMAPRTMTAVAAETPLSDIGIFEAMAGLFATSEGGQHYIDLYREHGSEMGQIGVADPSLMLDAAGTLQNFLPGLEALVTGRGDEEIVTQQMVDDALDIWQRLAAASSPELASTINNELAQTNNLQDFVGLSFAEWAAALGVDPYHVYLPMVLRP